MLSNNRGRPENLRSPFCTLSFHPKYPGWPPARVFANRIAASVKSRQASPHEVEMRCPCTSWWNYQIYDHWISDGKASSKNWNMLCVLQIVNGAPIGLLRGSPHSLSLPL